MVKKKKGWVRLVEAFLSIILITSLLVISISRENVEEDFYPRIYEAEVNLLRGIEVNNSLREEILSVGGLPVEWDSGFPLSVKNKINNEKLVYLNCSAVICEIEGECELAVNTYENVYSRSVGIFASESEYSPRFLRLYCWTNNL